MTEAASIAEVAYAAAEPTKLTDSLYAFVRRDGAIEVVDTRDHDEDWDAIRKRGPRGTVVVRDVASFHGYFEKYEMASEVFADADALVVCGVIDAGRTSEAGWQRHKVNLQLQKSVAWQTWARVDGALLSQTEFAELIEDRLVDITDPAAADVLELVQDFHVSSAGSFQQRQPLAGGATAFTYVDDQKAHGAGKLQIPKQLTLQLAPFVGAAAVEVIARFRYRLRDGHLALGVKLTRPEEVLRTAFLDICEQVAAATNYPVWQGRPLA